MNTIFQENDSVHDFDHGKGVIFSIEGGKVIVYFEEYKWSFSIREANLRLSFTPYDLINGGFSQERPKPEIEKGTVIYVKDEDDSFWRVARFVRMLDDGVRVSSEVGSHVDFSYYSLENPLK